MIVIGTSLVVEPFASLVGKASPTAPRLLINRRPGTKAEVMVDSMSIYWGFLRHGRSPKKHCCFNTKMVQSWKILGVRGTTISRNLQINKSNNRERERERRERERERERERRERKREKDIYIYMDEIQYSDTSFRHCRHWNDD